MSHKPTNLLPLSRQKQFVREYLFRFGVVLVALFIMLLATAAVLLVPTYIYLVTNTPVKEAHLAEIKSTLASADDAALGARLSSLANDASALLSLSDRSRASARIRAMLGVSRPGITLSGLSYTSGVDKNPNTLSLTGRAMTRDALRSYQLALQSTPAVLSVDLPISAYAKDTNSAFTITLSLAP